MKAADLKKGVRYWCGWASRYAYFQKIETRKWAGQEITKVVFRDVAGTYIECSPAAVEKWVQEKH